MQKKRVKRFFSGGVVRLYMYMCCILKCKFLCVGVGMNKVVICAMMQENTRTRKFDVSIYFFIETIKRLIGMYVRIK